MHTVVTGNLSTLIHQITKVYGFRGQKNAYYCHLDFVTSIE